MSLQAAGSPANPLNGCWPLVGGSIPPPTVQVTWIERLFVVLSQGSVKAPLFAGTEQLCRPMQSASTTACDEEALHEPAAKLPQAPVGVPKLANVTLSIVCPEGQVSVTVAFSAPVPQTVVPPPAPPVAALPPLPVAPVPPCPVAPPVPMAPALPPAPVDPPWAFAPPVPPVPLPLPPAPPFAPPVALPPLPPDPLPVAPPLAVVPPEPVLPPLAVVPPDPVPPPLPVVPPVPVVPDDPP